MRSMPSRIAKLTALFSIGFPILIDDDLSILQFRGDPAFDTTVIALCKHLGHLFLITPLPFLLGRFRGLRLPPPPRFYGSERRRKPTQKTVGHVARLAHGFDEL